MSSGTTQSVAIADVRVRWRPGYFVRRAFEAMVRSPRITMAATLTIYVAILVTGLFAGTLRSAEALIAAWAGEAQISVYLDPRADLDAARAAAQAIAPGRNVEAVAASEALRRFRESLGAQAALLEGLPADALPPSIEVRAPGLRLHQVRALAERLQQVPGAQEVDYGAAWLEPLERFVIRARWIGAILFAALAAGAAVLVSNTLRLGVFARRDEIEIMRLVGATHAFVEAPFLIEGFLQGVLGGALAAVTLSLAAHGLLPRLAGTLGGGALQQARILPPAILLGLAGGGAALGLISSARAVTRELRTRR